MSLLPAGTDASTPSDESIAPVASTNPVDSASGAIGRTPLHLAWLLRPSTNIDQSTVAVDADLTGAYAWPSGTKLAVDLEHLATCRDQRVADLGCGLGQLGFTALGLGARTVVFADGSSVVVDHIARTIALNHVDARAQVVLHQWGDPIPGGTFPLIVGGDILYRPECFMALVDTIASSLAPGGVCLLSEPRHRCEDELLTAIAARSLSWERHRRDQGYSLMRLRWA